MIGSTYQSADSLLKEIALKTRPEFHSCLISVLVLLFVPFAVSAQTSPKDSQGFPILGFSPANAAAEHNLEAIFEALPSPEKAREWHRLFTAEPHPAASEQNNKLAEFLALEWRKQGWEDVTLRRYDVLHSSPRSVSLEMVAPIYFKASLREDPMRLIRTRRIPPFRVPTLAILLPVMSRLSLSMRTVGIPKTMNY
jgi:hypothetical protein